MTDPKDIASKRCLREIYRIEFKDGESGYMIINPAKYRPILLDGSMCNACRDDRPCFWFDIGARANECPDEVIRKTLEDCNV